PLLSALGADGRFTAYAIDMRGFGFTDRPRDALYNTTGYAEHVLQFLDAMKIERAVLVGHSLGGEVALRLAAERPDRVSGLVLADATAYGSPSPWSQALQRLVFVPPFNRSLVRAVFSRPWYLRATLTRAYANTSTVDLSEVIAEIRKPLQQRGAEDALIAMVRTRSEPVTTAMVNRVRAPTLVIWGEDDKIVSVDTGRRLQREIEGSRLIVYPR